MLIFQRARIIGLNFFQHLRHAVGAEKRRTLGALDVAHCFSQICTLV